MATASKRKSSKAQKDLGLEPKAPKAKKASKAKPKKAENQPQAREGYKISNGHEVPIGHRYDVKTGQIVEETRGKRKDSAAKLQPPKAKKTKANEKPKSPEVEKLEPREGYKISNGHEVPLGHRFDVKTGTIVKETRGKKHTGPSARSKAISFGISAIDEQELNREMERLGSDRSPLLYKFFREGMARLQSGDSDGKAPAPTRPVVVMLSVSHLEDIAMAQEAWKLGAVVITPALNTAQLRLGLSDELFDSAIPSYIRTADAVLFGKGVGKSNKVGELKSTAALYGRPVFTTLAQLSKWMRRNDKAAA